jgi:galactitol-specific phosphotransferase system IIC component
MTEIEKLCVKMACCAIMPLMAHAIIVGLKEVAEDWREFFTLRMKGDALSQHGVGMGLFLAGVLGMMVAVLGLTA